METQLRNHGLRVTTPRLAILQWLGQAPHATVEQIQNGINTELDSRFSKQAIYDVLSVCINVGLVRQIKPAGHPARFERRVGDNHHHIICRHCGSIVDSDCTGSAVPCFQPDNTQGYLIDEAEIVFWGLCPDCQQTDRHSSA